MGVHTAHHLEEWGGNEWTLVQVCLHQQFPHQHWNSIENDAIVLYEVDIMLIREAMYVLHYYYCRLLHSKLKPECQEQDEQTNTHMKQI